MSTQQYSRLWHAEKVAPTPEERRGDRPTQPEEMTGFWRIQSAKTKPDYPVAIWKQEGYADVIFQIGRQRPAMTTDKTPIEKRPDKKSPAELWDEFTEHSWLKCVAVTRVDYDFAMDNGRWPDGKPSRQLSEDERLGLAAPADQANDNRSLDERLGDEINALIAAISKQGEPASQAEADKLSGDLDLLRGLLKKAEAERVVEKEPHLRASREVDARWGAITKPGQDAYDAAEKRRRAFLKKEQDRRDAEVRAENERRRKEAEAIAAAERARVEQETRERLAHEAEEAARIAALTKTPVAVADVEAEVAAAVATVEAPQVEEVQSETVRAGSAYGRASGLKSVTRGEIVDMAAFRNSPAIANHNDMHELLQRLADRAAKAGIEIPGMKIVKEKV